jgi:hypothetical protein
VVDLTDPIDSSAKVMSYEDQLKAAKRRKGALQFQVKQLGDQAVRAEIAALHAESKLLQRKVDAAASCARAQAEAATGEAPWPAGKKKMVVEESDEDEEVEDDSRAATGEVCSYLTCVHACVV